MGCLIHILVKSFCIDRAADLGPEGSEMNGNRDFWRKENTEKLLKVVGVSPG